MPQGLDALDAEHTRECRLKPFCNKDLRTGIGLAGGGWKGQWPRSDRAVRAQTSPPFLLLDANVKNVISVSSIGMPRRLPVKASQSRYLTTRESAARLGVTINAIKTWIREERLPALRTPGGHHRIAEPDLVEFHARLAENSRTPASTRPRILVVDDDGPLLAALRETIEQVRAFRPDVLVLDIRMPRLDGFEVCRRLKAKKDTGSIRILAVTAHPEGHVRDQIMACGADDFLEKPFAIEKFRSRVVGLLARGLRA